ncbi:MAG: Hint domain-containing protein [Rhodobacteraceae bacterium]|nr:MAG: Hint domain-containing protein [Paracoccaceae bacterium]
MGDYTYTSYAVYSSSDGSNVILPTKTPGTILDGDNDNEFETGDSGGLDPETGASQLTYVGTLDTVGGTYYPVFRDTDLNNYWVFAYDNGELPFVIDLRDIFPHNTFLFCFAAGTRIATGSGERAVEDLRIGDPVMTAEDRIAPVKWIGRQTLFPQFAGERTAPVRISAGALGGGLPHSDLTVTADHGMVIDGLVINASALVNGESIVFVPRADLANAVTYYHVETEDHDVILANGAPAETFIDYLDRRAFDNYREYLDLYGAERIIREMDRPRVSAARLVPGKIKARLGIARNAGAFVGSNVA